MSTLVSLPAAAAFKAIAFGLLLGACASVAPGGGTFEGTAWQVTAIDGAATPRTDMYRLEFSNRQIGGRFGCNQFGGHYRIEGERLVAEEVVSTLMGCPEPAATHETKGMAVLRQPMRIVWHSDRRITLSNSAGSISLEQRN